MTSRIHQASHKVALRERKFGRFEDTRASKMDDTQRIVKCGNLSLHTPGGFFKKRWHSKYLVLYDGSKSGVKRLELFESEIKFKKQNPVKIIPLVDCVRVVTCQRHKTTFTFEVRTSDQFYLLASKSFQDMNDWVNCLRLVAFGQQQQPETSAGQQRALANQQLPARDAMPIATNKCQLNAIDSNASQVDVLLSCQPTSTLSAANESKQHTKSVAIGVRATNKQLVANSMTSAKVTSAKPELRPQILTASQAAETAASALAKARQRQPSLLGSCKPQPPDDSPFIKQAPQVVAGAGVGGAPEQMDTLTPTVRGQLIAATVSTACKPFLQQQQQQTRVSPTEARTTKQLVQIGPALDEEEENMLYCSIEDNPSEHNYRVKVIETELALRCELKCYQLTGSTTISQQYEQLAQFRPATNHTQTPTNQENTAAANNNNNNSVNHPAIITFYQLIIGPQELTLLNDYATSAAQARATPTNSKPNQQGLWSWPYQCIRRYGFDKDNCFMFEAGRKCTSGPGQFVVQTPKAYNIYQDVVKFVNELRTINAGGPSQRPIAMTQAQTNDSIQTRGENQFAKQLTVTQIPVVWTPSGTGANVATINTEHKTNQVTDCPRESLTISQVVASRKQYFDGLQQPPDGEHLPRAEGGQTEAGQVASAAAVAANTNTNCKTKTKSMQLKSEPLTHKDQSEPPPRPPPMLMTSRTPTREAPQEEKLQKRPQLSSMSSCASDETDESGYEQGDDSVDSGTSSQHKQSELLDSRQASGGVDPSGGLTTNSNRLHESGRSRSNLSSTASSCSPASSASNSPGQSISRRTAEHISNSSMGSGGGSNGAPPTCQSSTRPRLPLLSELTRASPKAIGNKITPSERNSTPNLHALLTASLLDDGRGSKSETQTGAARPASLIKSLKANGFENDFETSLIRDVYSEISKLHAQFAVTTTGAEDSLSSGGESAAASSSSLENNNSNEVMRAGEGDDHSQSDFDDLMGRNATADEQEPMYSNLKTVAELNSARRSAEERGTSDRCHQVSGQPMRPINANRIHFHEPIRPPPLYPSMLNPIPEIVEHNQTTAHPNPNHDQRETSQARDFKASNCQSQTQRQLLRQNDYSAELDKSMDLHRARLALNREAIKKSQQSVGPQQCQQQLRQKSASLSMGHHLSRPTNHYLINDVHYAKISRNMASVGRSQHQDNIQRRR